MEEGIKNFILTKLFFPKVAVIDRPGIIYNVLTKRYGRGESKRRVIFYFEDTMSDLFIETSKLLGKQENSDLWYKIGKEAGIRYMLLSNTSKFPKFLIPSIVKYVLVQFKLAGMSFADNIKYNPKERRVIVKGKDCIICRKTSDPSPFTGLLSGVLSYILMENVEAKYLCKNCPHECFIIANRNIEQRYLVDFSKLLRFKKFEKYNYPRDIQFPKDYYSFKDLLKFKKICIDNKTAKIYLNNQVIVPSEIGLSGIVMEHCSVVGKDILNEIIINSGSRIARSIFSKEKDSGKLIQEIIKTMSALGWGILYYRKVGEDIHITFLYPPISEYEFLYPSLVLNGFLNFCLEKRFKIKKINPADDFRSIEVIYTAI